MRSPGIAAVSRDSRDGRGVRFRIVCDRAGHDRLRRSRAARSCRDATADAADASVSPEAGGGAVAPQSYALRITSVDTTFVTEDHFIASLEMQLSGEPFAEAMGRDLGGYSRDYSCPGSVCSPSVYQDPALTGDDGGPAPRIDLAGYSSGIESYEYSKQPMNGIAFESGAGTSLLFGPVLNPTGATGAAALQIAQNWFLHMAGASNAHEPVRECRLLGVQSARVARSLADAAAVLVLESGHPADPRHRLLDQLGRRPGAEGSARLRQLRVRLQHAAPSGSRRGRVEDDRARLFGLGRLERGPLDAQLSPGDARRSRGRDHRGAAQPPRQRGHSRQRRGRRRGRRGPISARATSRAFRRATSSRSWTIKRRSGSRS